MGRPPSCICGTCDKCRRREYMRDWYAQRPGYAADQARKHRARAREYERRKYHSDQAFRERKLARMATNTAIRQGVIVPQPCEVCGATNAEAHHDDYSKPLNVRWLCKPHHEEHHRMQYLNEARAA